MNYSTALWTCAELQRTWRLASDRKWGISHQNTLFSRLVRFMSRSYFMCGRRRVFSFVCPPGCGYKRPALQPFVPAGLPSGACLYCILSRRRALVRYSGNIELSRFPFCFLFTSCRLRLTLQLRQPLSRSGCAGGSSLLRYVSSV